MNTDSIWQQVCERLHVTPKTYGDYVFFGNMPKAFSRHRFTVTIPDNDVIEGAIDAMVYDAIMQHVDPATVGYIPDINVTQETDALTGITKTVLRVTLLQVQNVGLYEYE